MAIDFLRLTTNYDSYQFYVYEDYALGDITAYEGEKFVSLEIRQSAPAADTIKMPVLKGGTTYYYLSLAVNADLSLQSFSWAQMWNAFDYGVKIHLSNKYGASSQDSGTLLHDFKNFNVNLMYYLMGGVIGGLPMDVFTYAGGNIRELPLELNYPLTITCNFNTGTGLPQPPSQAGVGNKSLTVTQPSSPQKSGSTFFGWALTEEGEKLTFPYAYTTQQTSGDIAFTLYALWEAISNEVVYHLDGGTNNELNPLIYDQNTSFNFYDPFKAGHAFLGWYDSAQWENRKYGITLNSPPGLTFYARWSAKSAAKGGYVYRKREV